MHKATQDPLWPHTILEFDDGLIFWLVRWGFLQVKALEKEGKAEKHRNQGKEMG